ncbi:MAG: urea transporter [Oceanospirillaceae bacterium]|nr:urea transporter [Oceanospirillaceae bacterium]
MDNIFSPRIRHELGLWVDALLCSFSQVLFQNRRRCGAILLLAITIESPQLLAGALAGCIAALTGARISGFDRQRLRAGHYGFNGALIGLGVVALAGLSSATLSLIGLFGLLSAPLMEWQLRRFPLPPYTSVFILLGWCAWALLPTEPALPMSPTASLPLTLQSVILGLGQVLFLGTPVAAMLVLLALALGSTRDCGWALVGALTGTLVAGGLSVAAGDLQQGLYGFNAALAAVALSLRFGHQPLLILAGGALSTLLQPLLAQCGIPPFTAPFVLSCWLIGLMASILQSRRAATS